MLTRTPCDPADRREPSAKAEYALANYFVNKRCVVTGATTSVDWHHVKYRSSSNRFEDFLPLGAGPNVKLRDIQTEVRRRRTARRPNRSVRPSSFEVPEILKPETLVDNARRSHAFWDVSRAFGQCRLGYYVARLIGEDHDHLMRYAAGTLRYLRHRPNYDLLRDVLACDVAPLTSETSLISGDAAVTMLVELAYVYSEHRAVTQSVAIHDAIAPKLRRRDDGWSANVRRRRENVRALLESSTRRAVDRIGRGAELAPGNLGIQVASRTYTAYHYFGAGEARTARDVLEEEHRERLVEAVENYAREPFTMDQTAIPSVSVAIGAQFVQAYTLIRGAAGSRSWKRAERYRHIVDGSFRQGGMLLDHEVPFAWSDVLPGHEVLVCRMLDAQTRRLLDRITARLLPLVTG